MNEIEGKRVGEGRKFAIVVSRFNEVVTQRLKDGAMDCLLKQKTNDNDVDIIYVPGSFELPGVCSRLSVGGKYDAIIALGAVIRGETAHFEYVAGQAARGIGNLTAQSKVPIIFGVLTTDNLQQALERSGLEHGNKGWEAALAAMEMADLYSKL